jgi:hypothetical protein
VDWPTLARSTTSPTVRGPVAEAGRARISAEPAKRRTGYADFVIAGPASPGQGFWYGRVAPVSALCSVTLMPFCSSFGYSILSKMLSGRR